jgi:hypothetical protein
VRHFSRFGSRTVMWAAVHPPALNAYFATARQPSTFECDFSFLFSHGFTADPLLWAGEIMKGIGCCLFYSKEVTKTSTRTAGQSLDRHPNSRLLRLPSLHRVPRHGFSYRQDGCRAVSLSVPSKRSCWRTGWADIANEVLATEKGRL